MKKTIDFIVPVLGNGGGEKILLTLVNYLSDLGLRIRIFALSGTDDGSSPNLGKYEKYILVSDGEYISSLDDYAIIYQLFVSKLGVPDLVISVSFPLICRFAHLALDGLGVSRPILAWLHAPISVYKDVNGGSYDMLSYADAALVLSTSEKANLISNCPNLDVYLVNNPVELQNLPIIPFENRSKILLYIGRLSSEKRIDTILEAISQTKDWQLRVVGDGPTRYSLISQCSSLHIQDRIHFLGWQDSPWNYADGCCALILASEYEGFPTVAIESLGRGLPVISTPVNGITDIIIPHKNGFLFPHDGSNELAKILSDNDFSVLDAFYCQKCVAPYEKNVALRGYWNIIRKYLNLVLY